MFTRYRVSSNNNSSKEDSDTRETSNLSGLHQAHASEPPLGCWGNWAAASGAGASPSLGRRGARAQQAGPGAQRRSSSESLFPAREFGEHRARETPAIGGELRGRHREHRWAAGPSGAAASARGSGPTGQPGGRAGGRARPGPRDPATRVGPGAEHPGRLRPSRQGWHGRARGWELHNLAAAPAGPASSRGEPERGAPEGCPRDPRPRRPPRASPGLRRLPGPRTQAVPGWRGVRSASSARSPGRDRHSPRPPRLGAADPRRSLLPRLAVPCGRTRPRALRTGGLGPACPPPAPRSPSPPEFGALLQCLRG